MYRAMSSMWDAGDIVLRSIRIRAHRIDDDATREALIQFFKPFLTFAYAYITVRLPSALIDELKQAADEFEHALANTNNDAEAVSRTAQAGYRFRNTSLKASAAVEDDFLPALATCLAAHPDAAIALLVLSRGYDGDTMSRRRWAARMIHPKKGTLRRIFTLPRDARRMWRAHNALAQHFNDELVSHLAAPHDQQRVPPRRRFNRVRYRRWPR